MVARASCAVAGPAVAFCVESVTQEPVQPSAYPTRTRPVLSTVMSLKSSRLREGWLPPPFHMQPRCTGSEDVVSTVVQVRPVLYVKATYRCQTPRKSADCVSPVVCVPRNAKAARLSSPAITSANSAFCIPKGVPASLDFDQCSPRSKEEAILACPSLFTYPR